MVALRPAAKPLHPRGPVLTGTVVRHGGLHLGAAWLDDAGTHDALVRFSPAAGLPRGFPDVQGLAMRVTLSGDTFGDLLLASTGSGLLGRFLLKPVRRPDGTFHGSLLPYRTPSGPVVLGARPRPDGYWDLLAALGTGDWSTYGEFSIGPPSSGPNVSFDPVLHPLPGLEQYDAVRRLRLPAYRAARRSRGMVLSDEAG